MGGGLGYVNICKQLFINIQPLHTAKSHCPHHMVHSALSSMLGLWERLCRFFAERLNISNISTVYITSYSTVRLEKDPSARAQPGAYNSGTGGLMENSDQAITNIITHLSAGNATASIQTTCHASTHRSVAAAEIVKGKLLRRGVGRVVVVHAHRRKRPGDAF
jgi:hypothetical protein